MLSAMDKAKIVFLDDDEQPNEDPRYLVDVRGRGLPGKVVRYDGSGVTIQLSEQPTRAELEKHAETAGLLGHASLFVKGCP
jgi:hypothetical protein